MSKLLPHRLLRDSPWPLLAFVFGALVAGAGLGAPSRVAAPLPVGWGDGSAAVMVTAPDLLALAPGTVVLPPWSPMDARPVLLREGVVVRDAARSAVAAGEAELELAGHWTRVSTQVAPPTSAVRWQASEHLREATVSVGERVCTSFVFGQWRCGPNAWNDVGPMQVEGSRGAEPCLWAHPSEEGPLRVSWSDVAAGRFSGRAGLTETARVAEGLAPVNFRVLWNGEEVAARAFSESRGLRRVAGTLGESAGELGQLTVEVQAEDVGQRHFCFDLDVRPHRPRRDATNGAGGDEREGSAREDGENNDDENNDGDNNDGENNDGENNDGENNDGERRGSGLGGDVGRTQNEGVALEPRSGSAERRAPTFSRRPVFQANGIERPQPHRVERMPPHQGVEDRSVSAVGDGQAEGSGESR